MAKSKRGRKELEFDEKDKELASFMKLAGRTDKEIAAYFGITAPTYRKHFRDHVSTRKSELDGLVVSKLFSLIKKGNTAATIFYLKTRLGWSEKNVMINGQEVVGANDAVNLKVTIAPPPEPPASDASSDTK